MSISRKGQPSMRKKDDPVNGGGSTYNISPGNFWDLGNYKRTVRRIDDGANICDELVKMFTERAEYETEYSQKLSKWQERWSKKIDQSSMYATMKHATLGALKEAHDRAQIHMDCYSKIHNQVIETVKRWKESHYHKAFVGWKETKEYEEEFAKAQKPWAVAYGKVHKAKKNYHGACKSLETAQTALEAAKNDPMGEAPPEKLKKFEETCRKNSGNAAAMKGKYEEKLRRIEPMNGTYEEEMRKVADKWSRSEESRKNFIQDTLVSFHKAVNVTSDNRLKECFDNQLQVAYSGNSKYDVNWWQENYGADMARNWPKFEEFGDSPPTPEMVRPPQLSTDEPPKGNSNSSLPTYNNDTQPRSMSISSQAGQQQQQVVVAQQAEEDLASNPFMNGGDNDNYDDDDWDVPDVPTPVAGGDGISVRALYDYQKVEEDELSFRAGEVLQKLTEEDDQGWCRGKIGDLEGLYPANYVEII